LQLKFEAAPGDTATGLIVLGECALQARRYDEAQKHLEQAVREQEKIAPDFTRGYARYLLAKARRADGKTKEADAAAEEARKDLQAVGTPRALQALQALDVWAARERG
jgi:tetratricopeptide (TPR) repeat protein